MHDAKARFACAAVAGCIIVAGRHGLKPTAEVFDEVLDQWLQLPCDSPLGGKQYCKSSALL